MDKGVVFSESELSAACNKLVNYADFLSRQIAEYNSILKRIQDSAICDELICKNLSLLSEVMKPYSVLISHTVSNAVGKQIRAEKTEIEAADKFQFPNELMASISALLAQFL